MGSGLWWWFWETGDGGGGDCRKVEADSGDFQRSVGDRCVGKVQQLKRWVVVCSEERQCGQRREGEASILWT